MATFLFRGDDVFKPIGVMSGGERARLLLLKLMLAGDNFLLLDEPTNHLDIASREALEDALSGYDGTILAVSHDRYFINRMAGRVVALTPDGVEQIGGDYDAYAAKRRMEAAPPPVPKAPSNNTYKQRKEQASAIRRLTTAVRRAEEAVAALEEEIASLNEQLADPATAADYERLTTLTATLNEKNDELMVQMELWEQTQLELEELTSENDG
jgi:ATP-binding cassette subfamily F protein 3